MQVELTRFKVKPGMSSVVDEWLKFLNDNMEGVLLTLEREKMYVETIFREKMSICIGIQYKGKVPRVWRHQNITLIRNILNIGKNVLILVISLKTYYQR